MIDNLNIKELLTAWGRWASRGSSQSFTNVGYKSAWAMILPSPGRGVSVDYDSDMLDVEHAMSYLKVHGRWSYRLLKLKYLYGYSYNRLAAKLTRELPEYKRGGDKAGQKMCDKHCKKLVDEAEQVIELLIKEEA
ncbi:antiterminator Q family protein [Psychrobacter pygoscelis]|uniref:antiterminator Q family protein n=1 Tax=Psychrobacter pygoscelis TaxID=2488563 RepID=UPI001038DC68|nr:antiterminator Q family protein [Psychrobacter pygoscelis]